MAPLTEEIGAHRDLLRTPQVESASGASVEGQCTPTNGALLVIGLGLRVGVGVGVGVGF